MNTATIKFYFRSNKNLLTWILQQDKAQHIKMRYELEKEVKEGLRSKFIDKAELELLTKLTSGNTQRDFIINEFKN